MNSSIVLLVAILVVVICAAYLFYYSKQHSFHGEDTPDENRNYDTNQFNQMNGLDPETKRAIRQIADDVRCIKVIMLFSFASVILAFILINMS